MSEIRNFNQSLLYYTLTNSQSNLSHPNNDKKHYPHNLFNDLNMTYSRLTTQNSYERTESQRQSRFMDYLSEIQQTDHSMEFQQVSQCANCQKLKKQLKTVELFLQQIETKFIKKEHILIGTFSKIHNELQQLKEENQTYKNLYHKTLDSLNSAKDSIKPPKIDLMSARTSGNNQNTSRNLQEVQCLSTMESAHDPLSKRHKYFSTKHINNRLSTQYDEKYKFPTTNSIIKDPSQHSKSDSSTVQLQYTESQQDQYSQILETYKFKVIDSNTHNNPQIIKSKFNKSKLNTGQKSKYSQVQVDKLKFQNDNLKNYNTVLLEHCGKSKRLASKIFNLYRN